MRIGLVTLCANNAGQLPIAMLCLQAYCQSRFPYHLVEIVDASVEDPLAKMADRRYDLVGIGSLTPEYELATQFAREVSRLLPDALRVLGGIHISKLPSSFRREFDVAVLGEGEVALCEIISAMEDETPMSEIKGIMFWSGGSPVTTEPRPTMDLNNFPSLNYRAIHPSYFSRRPIPNFAEFGVEGVMMTSRGCPYKCVFCGSGHMWSKVRYFPVDWVLREMRSLMAMGVTHLSIFDDVFALNKPRLKQIADAKAASTATRQLKLYANAKADAIDQEICDLLKSMNCRHIFFGFESGSERNLHFLKAGKVTVVQNRDAVKLCVSNNMQVTGNVIIGSPGESLADMLETIAFIDWFRRNGGNRMLCSVMTPFPGTPMWEIAKQRGVVSDDMDFSRLGMDNIGDYMAGFVVDKKISSSEFSDIFKAALRAIHPFKWRKARQFLCNCPIETTRFAMRAPWPLIRRMFVKEST